MKTKYRILRHPADVAAGDTHPWCINIYRDGEWAGAVCYESGAEAIEAYVVGLAAKQASS